MESMEGFLRRHVGDKFASVPVVLNGDLNTVPGVGVYRQVSFLQPGHVSVLPSAFMWSHEGRESLWQLADVLTCYRFALRSYATRCSINLEAAVIVIPETDSRTPYQGKMFGSRPAAREVDCEQEVVLHGYPES